MDGVTALRLVVEAATDLGAHLRELRLGGDLEGFDPWPGQDVMVNVLDERGTPRWRRYTVRDHDRSQLTLWVATDTPGPGAAWARAARRGDRVEAVGPRGKLGVVDDADGHVFVVDLAGLAAAHAMIASLRAGAAVAVVPAGLPEGLAPVGHDGVTVRAVGLQWPGEAAGVRDAVTEALGSLDGATRVAGYAFCERTLSLAAREALLAGGVGTERLAVKAFWRADRANEDHGEPSREDPA